MFEKITEKVFAFLPENGGSNCYLLKGSKQIALVDSSSSGNRDFLLSSLQQLKLSPKDLSLILHTHCHADHIGCDSLFPKAGIAMHEADAEYVDRKDKAVTCAGFFPETAFPQITSFLSQGQEIDLGSVSLQVIHTPGHTIGGVCFLEPGEGMLFSGDTLFKAGFGRTDLPTGSRQQLVESLKTLQKVPFKTLLPGHGPILQGAEENSGNVKNALNTIGKDAFL